MGSYRLVKMLNPISITVNGTFTPKGAYNGATSYSVGDQVDYNGTSYILYSAASAGTLPTDNTKWGVLASKGDKGDKGDTGATGLKGDKGDTGLTGAAGTNGQGVPTGGTTGQQLAKINGTDYNTQWVNPIDISGKADTSALTAHTSNTSNPHSVTKAQVGLGSVPDTDFTSAIAAKQDTLVSGTNIKTINSTSILGSGDIVIGGAVDSVNTQTGVVVLDTDDIAEGTNKYVTSAEKTILSNTSGVNTGDQDISGIATNASDITSKVSKAGDTMTGKLTISSGGTYINGNVDLRGATGGYLNVYDIVYGNGYYSEGHVYPTLNKVYNLGTSAKYWNNSYTNRLYLNSTAYLDGSTAGTTALSGKLFITDTASTTSLKVSGSASVSADVRMLIGGTGNGATGRGTSFDIEVPGASSQQAGARLTAYTTGGATVSQSADLAISTASIGTLSEVMRITSNNLVGIGTTTPTHTLTLPSTATGIVQYNTVDQTTNYERVRQYWSSNTFLIESGKGGTGTNRDISIRGNTSEVLVGYGVSNWGITLKRDATAYDLVQVTSSGMTKSSGNQNALGITPTITQTSTAGYTALLINPTETSTGSGAKNLIDAQVGGTSKFKVANTGDAEITTSSAGVILKSPNGTRWRVTIDNTGALNSTAI